MKSSLYESPVVLRDVILSGASVFLANAAKVGYFFGSYQHASVNVTDLYKKTFECSRRLVYPHRNCTKKV